MAVEAPTLQHVYETGGGTGGGTGGESIHELLNNIRGAVGPVQKTGKNSFHNFDYLTESDITDPVKKWALQFGVSIEPSITDIQYHEKLVTVTVRIDYVNIYGGESISQFWACSETTVSDKGATDKYCISKAATGAVKYALAKMFGLSDNSIDSEGSQSTNGAERKSTTRKAPAPPVEKKTLKETAKAERPFSPERVAAAIQHAGKLEKYNRPITEDQILHVTDALKQVPINNSDPFAGAVFLAGLTGIKTGKVKDMTEGHARTVLNWLGYNIETGKLDPDKDGQIELQSCLETWKLT